MRQRGGSEVAEWQQAAAGQRSGSKAAEGQRSGSKAAEGQRGGSKAAGQQRGSEVQNNILFGNIY